MMEQSGEGMAYDDIVDEYDIKAPKVKIALEDIRKTINYVSGRNEARNAINNIRRIMRNERGR